MTDRLQFNLIENSLDYLMSAAEYAERTSPRDLKYSILHLVAGIELLLKARLRQEHWSLLFADVDKVSESALQSGDFQSVTLETAYGRLRRIAAVSVEESVFSHLEYLRKLRNRIQHFSVDVDVLEARSVLAKGLNFALDFAERHLGNEFDANKVEAFSEVVGHLKHFQEFVRERLESVREDVAGAPHLIECPRCWQDTLMIGDGNPRCPFCYYETTAEDLAEDISEGPAETCPECDRGSLAFIVYNNEDGGWLCTSCAQSDHERCARCDSLFSDGGLFCDSCLAWIKEYG